MGVGSTSGNIDNPHGFTYEGRIGGGPAPILEFTTKSNCGVSKGDVIVLETTGLVDVTAADQGTSGEPVVGIAAEDVTATAATQKQVAVYCALPDVLFGVQVDEGSDFSQTHIGQYFDTNVGDGTGKHQLDLATSSADTWKVIGLKSYDGNAMGTFADVLVQPVMSNCLWGI
jgi:hypothetical protein